MKSNFINQQLHSPFPTAGAITGGAGLLGAGINAWATSANNRKQRNWNWRMYQHQRQDALSDWNMQNEYNSPQNQMARFKEAGLNPNLIYGQTNEAPVIRSTDAKSYNPEAPQVDLGGIARDTLSAYYDAQQKPLQTDNLRKAVEIATEQVRLVQAQTAQTLAQGKALAVGTDKAEFDLALQRSLLPLTLEKAQTELNKQKADLQYTVDNNARQAASNAKSIEEATARIRSMALQNANTEAERKVIDQRLRILQQDERIRKFDEDMLKAGARPGDKLWERKLMEVLSAVYKEMFPDKQPPRAPAGSGYQYPLEKLRERARKASNR